jgi:CDP-glucose 4,6-dehydratase
MNFQSFYKDKRVLVTGHTGFKGAWLTEWLLMMGAKVTGFALPPATEPALFDQLGLAGRCDHRIGDIRDRVLVRKVIHEVRPDLVFHLAAQPLVRLSYAQPVETYETNVMGTAHVLDALRDADWPCAAVMITTDKVYENHEQGRAYQESDPLGGYDPYSSSKACAELVIQTYRNSFFNPAKIQKEFEQKLAKNAKEGNCFSARGGGNMSSLRASRSSVQNLPIIGVASARAGNVIGGGDWAQDRIVPDCMRALAKGEIIAVRNPNATRPWQHVLEPLSGYLLLGMKLFEELNVRRETLDVTSKTDYSSRLTSNVSHLTPRVSHLTPHVSHLTSYSSSFNFGPHLSSNRPVRDLVEEILKNWAGRWEDRSDPGALHEAGLLNLATDKAVQVLGWKPRWDFAKTLGMTVIWYKAVYEGGASVVQELVQAQIGEYTAK